MSLNRAARTLRDNARIPYTQALRIAQSQAALRVYDSAACASLEWPFCASDTRLLSTDEPSEFTVVYDCLCPACLEANPK